MKYKTGDSVLYGQYGVCRIMGEESRKIKGESVKFYVLRPMYDDTSTIFVPQTNENLLGEMREVLTRAEVYEMIEEMPDEETVWIENENRRKEKYREMLLTGDRKTLVKMIKTLGLQQEKQREKGKKLHMTDERFLKEAEKVLHEEFAHVLGLPPEKIVSFIAEQLAANETEDSEK